MIRRRAYCVALATSAALGAPFGVSAQPGRLRHIGFIVPRLSSTDPTRAAGVAAFHRAMQEFGYRVGRDYRFDERSVEGRNERYDEVAAQLVANRVDLILVPGTSGAQAAQRATATIPIVFLSISDPVGTALVTSLARPGGNLTGRSSITAELDPKRLELLREAVPGLTSVAVLMLAGSTLHEAALADLQAAGRGYGIRVLPARVDSVAAVDTALARIRSQRVGGMLVFDQAAIISASERIVGFALAERLPTMFQASRWVRLGGLMSYGPNAVDDMQHVATYVAKIFKGASPGELPVEQPTKFELVINLKSGRTMGLAIPQSLLLRADEVIE